MAGYTLADPPKDDLEKSKANGMHYQWGRKDPFAGSYSSTPTSYIGGLLSVSVAPKGMLNRYGPDGISYLDLSTETATQTLRNAYKVPLKCIMPASAQYGWCNSGAATIQYLWNDVNGKKGLHDPCPAGWRVIAKNDLNALSQKGNISGKQTPNASNGVTAVTDGGLYIYFEANGSGNASYFRFPGYRRTTSSYEFIGQRSIIWMREYSARGENNYYSNGFDLYYPANNKYNSYGVTQDFSIQDGQVTRCIQERE